MKFIVKDKIACYVTWSYEIEAEDETEAYNRYLDGDYDRELGEEIGDSIDFVPSETTAEPA